MTTRLYPDDTLLDFSRGIRDLSPDGANRDWISRTFAAVPNGNNAVVCTSVTNPTDNTGGPVPNDGVSWLDWISLPVDRDVTISGSITANLWGTESSMSANAWIACKIQLVSGSTMAVTDIATSNAIGAELGTSAVARNATFSPTSTAVKKGDRLRLIVYFTDISGTSMASGFTLTFTYGLTTPASAGESYITFTEDFGFLTISPADPFAYNPGTNNVFLGSTNSRQKVAQRFVAPADGTLKRVDVSVAKNFTPSDNFVVSIQGESGGVPDGTDLGSASRAGGSITGSQVVYNFDLSPDITLVGGQAYYVVYSRSGAADDSVTYMVGGAATPAGGNHWQPAYGWNGSTWSRQEIACFFDASGTHSDADFLAGSTVLYLTETADVGSGHDSGSNSQFGTIQGGSGLFEMAGIGPIVIPDLTVSSLKIMMTKTGTPTDNLNVDIKDTLTGTVLGTSDAVAASGLGAGSFITFPFSTPASLSAGTIYLVVYRSGTRDTSNFASIGADSVNSDVDAQQRSSGGWSANSTVTPRFELPPGVNGQGRSMWLARGGGVQTTVRSLDTGPTTIPADLPLIWFSKKLQAFTLSGLVALNLRAEESVISVNAALRAELAVTDGDGSNPVAWAISMDGTEVTNSEAAYNFLLSGDDLAVAAGQRLRLRVYFDDAPGLATGSGTATLYFAGTSAAASGDSYITVPKTLLQVLDLMPHITMARSVS